MMVVSQLVLATGLLVSGVAGREDACRVERRVVCNLLAMLVTSPLSPGGQ